MELLVDKEGQPVVSILFPCMYVKGGGGRKTRGMCNLMTQRLVHVSEKPHLGIFEPGHRAIAVLCLLVHPGMSWRSRGNILKYHVHNSVTFTYSKHVLTVFVSAYFKSLTNLTEPTIFSRVHEDKFLCFFKTQPSSKRFKKNTSFFMFRFFSPVLKPIYSKGIVTNYFKSAVNHITSSERKRSK